MIGPALLLAGVGLLARYDLEHKPAIRWELPHALTEVSGLAVDRGGRLFAHADERARIYELDPADRRIVTELSLGRPAVGGDFEAIAVVDDRVVLTTSDGVLYAAPLGAERPAAAGGGAVEFVTYDTGVGRHCEVEGLAWWAPDRTLLLACKTPRDRTTAGTFTVFAWSVDRKTLAPAPALRIPIERLAQPIGERGFHPSELVRDPASGHYLVLAGRERALAELTAEGEVVAVIRLRKSHRQPEGMAIAADGSLVIADEGGKEQGTVSVYPRAR